ncbi:MAG TPA: DUF58 domain-containing protein [Pirellulales bacterium]|jgi:uncharacterized protein (DUF58 family)
MSQHSATTAAPLSRFLELGRLATLSHLRFAPRFRIEGAYSGRHPSRRQGGAGEFADYREYTDGEDLRRLDWKVLGRSGRAYVRLYQDETNLVGMLAIDCSGSMRFGERSAGRAAMARAATSGRRADGKLEHAQFLATAFGHVIAQGQDQVGLALLDERLQTFIPPGGTGSHLSRVNSAIEQIETKPISRMAEALRELFQRVARCGVLILISDFLQDDVGDVFNALRLFRRRRWEVVALHLVHPDEEQLPTGVAYRFEGLENDGVIISSPAEVAQRYEQRFKEHLSATRTLALSAGCDYQLVPTGIDYLETVRKFLVARSG